jgi:hypothetical protein
MKLKLARLAMLSLLLVLAILVVHGWFKEKKK